MLVQRPATRHPYTPLKIAILSGLSDPSTCALSDVQRDFLWRLDAPESAKIYRNFPYVDSAAPHRRPPLWLASLRNAQQFLGASKPAYVDRARPHWRALRDSADALFVITLSCGLEILRHCIDDDDAHRQIHILALGPVARSVPPLPCTIVQGKRDPITRAFFTPRHGHHISATASRFENGAPSISTTESRFPNEAPDISANESRFPNGAPSISTTESRFPNGAPDISANESRFPNGAPSISAPESRFPNGAPDISANESRFENGAPASSRPDRRLPAGTTHITLPNIGHLNYLESNAVVNLANAILCGNTLKSSAAVSTSRNAS